MGSETQLPLHPSEQKISLPKVNFADVFIVFSTLMNLS